MQMRKIYDKNLKNLISRLYQLSLTRFIALDDIEIENGACNLDVSCDFEDDFCGFYNNKLDDDFDWVKKEKNLDL